MTESPDHKSEKPHRKVASIHDVKFSADVMPSCPAYNFLGYADNLHSCMDKFGGLDNDDPVFFDDIDWEDNDAATLLRGFGDLMDHSFDIKNVAKNNELSTALNFPMISALNVYVPTLPDDATVCVVGADRGQNITQCELARHIKPVNWNIVCVEPTKSDYVRDKLRATLAPYKDAQVHFKTLQEACGDGDFYNRDGPIQFDLIIHNLGLHVLCATEEERLMYVQFVQTHLAPGGKMIGTSIDIDAVRRSDDLGMRSPSRTVELVQEYPPSERYAEGMAYVRVGTTMFKDPILSLNAIGAMFSVPGLHATLVPGKYLFRDHKDEYRSYAPQFTVPKTPFWNNVARRPELSIVTYIEVVKIPDDDIAIEYPVNPSITWEKMEYMTDNELSRCYFSMNHGRPLTGTDLSFCDSADIWLAPKWNGISGRVNVSTGIAHMYVEDGTFYRAILPSLPRKHNMRLQVEVIKKDNVMRVIVVDPYMIGVRSPTPFERRWVLFKEIYALSTVLQGIVEPQVYQRATGLNLRKLAAKVDDVDIDGIVIQPKHAMAGSFKDGVGSARYLKNRYTIDIECGGRICEVLYDNFEKGDMQVVRYRSDKFNPNTILQLYNIKNAMKISDFRDHLSLSRFNIELDDIPTVLRVLAGELDYKIIPYNERMSIFRGRYNDASVVQSIVQSSSNSYYKRLHYNMYMDIKNKVIKDIIMQYFSYNFSDSIDNLVIPGLKVKRDGGLVYGRIHEDTNLDIMAIGDAPSGF